MNMNEINARVLSNGMTRLDWWTKLNIGQDPVPCEVNARKILDVPFGTDSDRQKYDVYMPNEPGVYPTIFRVHGGGWFTGHRSDKNMIRYAKLAEHGYVVVSIGYRLANEAVFPGPVEDVWNGIQAVLAKADEYGIDKDRIGITAGSAGTSISALLAVQHPELIKVAILEAAILDFKGMRHHFERNERERKAYFYPDEDTSIEALYLGGSVLEVPEVAEAATPANFITENAPYFMLCHGLNDVTTPYLQSVEFARTLCKATGDDNRAEVVLLPGTAHGYQHLWNDPKLFDWKLDFLKRHL